MKREHILLLPVLVLAAVILAACGSSEETAAQVSPYVGAWAYVDFNPDVESRIYERVDALAVNATGFEIFPGGTLIVMHSEYVGGDFPTLIWSEGTWVEEGDGDLVFSYVYGESTRALQVEILRVEEHDLECVETRLNW